MPFMLARGMDDPFDRDRSVALFARPCDFVGCKMTIPGWSNWQLCQSLAHGVGSLKPLTRVIMQGLSDKFSPCFRYMWQPIEPLAESTLGYHLANFGRRFTREQLLIKTVAVQQSIHGHS